MSRGISFSFFVGIFGIIETMVDTKRFWVETFPPLVKKLSHFMLRKNPITEIKGQKVHYESQYRTHIHTPTKRNVGRMPNSSLQTK